jgi:hypothetical protein
MSEEREPDELVNLDEEYEDLSDFDEVSIEIEEYDDMAGLEDMPEETVVQGSHKDIIITYGDKIEDEIKNLEEEFKRKLSELENADPTIIIREINDVLNRSKMLEAHSLTAEISSYLASLLGSLDRHSEATEFCLQAVSESRKSEDDELRLKSLTSFGINLTYFDLKDASVVFSQAIELAEDLGNKKAIAVNTFYFANCQSETDLEQALSLYIDARKFFEETGENVWLGKIDFKLGKLQLENFQYQDALNILNSSKLYLKEHPRIRDEFKLDDVIERTNLLLLSGNTLKYRLKIPPPQIIEQTDQARKIYELLSEKSSFDIIKGLRNLHNVQVLTGDYAFDSLKWILDGSEHEKFSDDELKYTSDLYEDIGNLFVKDNKEINAYFYYISAQILYILTQNSKKAEKLHKKLFKLIEDISEEETTPQYFDQQIYMYYQLAYSNKSINPKEAQKCVNSGLELARKRDNPFYEGLFKEILGDIRKEKDLEKALVDYQSSITIYEALDGNIDLMRIYEKQGTEMLSTQTDKAKEILRKALEIAKKLRNEEVKIRIEGKL